MARILFSVSVMVLPGTLFAGQIETVSYHETESSFTWQFN